MEKINIKTHWFLVLMLWFAGIAAAMQFAKFSAAFDYLRSHYQTNPFWMGLSLSIVGFVGLVFGITMGIFVPKMGPRKILFTSLSLGCVISLLQSFSPAFPVLFASRIVEGISHLGIVVTAPIIMIMISCEKHHSFVMGLWGTFFGVAFFATAWLFNTVLKSFPVSALFLLHAIIMCIILGILVFSIKKDDIPTISYDNKISLIDAHKKVYANWRTFSPGILFFFLTFMLTALFTFLPGLSNREATKNTLLVILPLLSILGTFIAGVLSQKMVSPAKLSVFAFIILIILICIMRFSFENNVLFVITSVILMLCAGSIQGSVFALIPQISLSKEEQANGNGAVAQLGNLGSTCGAPVFSYFLTFGKESVIIIVALFSLFGAITGLFIVHKIKTQTRKGEE
jgi:predicted MFS family arabinose efflux permease